jgi:hypothetical protein
VTGIPQAAIEAAARALLEYMPAPDVDDRDRQAAAIEVLEAGEAAWPHDPPPAGGAP